MADMTAKHHNLIYDAIYEASYEFVRSKEMADMMDVHGMGNVLMGKRINRSFVRALGKAFACKLRYTNDNFEASVWQRQVEAIADEVFDAFSRGEN